MSLVVLMHAKGHNNDPEARDTIPCDSGITANFWAAKYKATGWKEVWVSGWMFIETRHTDAQLSEG